ncbi:MAG: metal-dependent transcriptional regulator [Flavobacteriaceae bacterium]|nr:metal-dependent transcriptional regulator [Flavobacteriaceae bacterium]
MSQTITNTEENYLKAIFHIQCYTGSDVNTNSLAAKMDTKASSTTDMIKKLANKNLVTYKKYQGVSLTDQGKSIAVDIIRKHRLWEVFLVDKLSFNWDDVHEIAEQLEHIVSGQLVDKLDSYLGFPSHDPHGDPIPSKNGDLVLHKKIMLSDLLIGESCVVVGVKDSSSSLLKYLDKNLVKLGSVIQIIDIEDFDQSVLVAIDEVEKNLSKEICKNLFVEKK